MTNQEAVLKLKIILGNALLNPRLKDQEEEFLKAVDMAIAALQSDPNAPDWSQAPEWARWYGIDLIDLKGYWYEKKPIYDDQDYIPKSGKYERDINANFQTLFKRPAK